MATCTRCNGSRYIQPYAHVEGGRCFRCQGSGVEPTKIARKAPRVAARPSRVTLTGNTYAVRGDLRALGARWDGSAWTIEAARAAEAQRLIDGPAHEDGDGPEYTMTEDDYLDLEAERARDFG